jgi:excisionase family DNA binding protein
MLPDRSARPWLNLSEAARYLGVHFTTLRRWADNGDIPCLRTPGGHRRFTRADLDIFLSRRRSLPAPVPANGLTAHAVDHTRTTIRSRAAAGENWYARFDEAWRARFRTTGQRFMGLLMQFVTRHNGGEAFLDEGLRLAVEYGHDCLQVGLSISETVQAFLFFRRSISDSIHGAESVAGEVDGDSQRLFDRMSDFMDAMLVATVEGYCQARDQLTGPENSAGRRQ